MPDPSDRSHERIGQAIFRLFTELEHEDYTFYKEIMAKHTEFKAQKIEFIDGKFSEDGGSDDQGSDSEDPYEGMEKPQPKPVKQAEAQTSEEFAKFQEEEEAAKQKKKAKKNLGFGTNQVTADEQEKIDQEIKQITTNKEGKTCCEGGPHHCDDEDDWETA